MRLNADVPTMETAACILELHKKLENEVPTNVLLKTAAFKEVAYRASGFFDTPSADTKVNELVSGLISKTLLVLNDWLSDESVSHMRSSAKVHLARTITQLEKAGLWTDKNRLQRKKLADIKQDNEKDKECMQTSAGRNFLLNQAKSPDVGLLRQVTILEMLAEVNFELPSVLETAKNLHDEFEMFPLVRTRLRKLMPECEGKIALQRAENQPVKYRRVVEEVPLAPRRISPDAHPAVKFFAQIESGDFDYAKIQAASEAQPDDVRLNAVYLFARYIVNFKTDKQFLPMVKAAYATIPKEICQLLETRTKPETLRQLSIRQLKREMFKFINEMQAGLEFLEDEKTRQLRLNDVVRGRVKGQEAINIIKGIAGGRTAQELAGIPEGMRILKAELKIAKPMRCVEILNGMLDANIPVEEVDVMARAIREPFFPKSEMYGQLSTVVSRCSHIMNKKRKKERNSHDS
ncbi:hypothetical protein FACS189425_07240 [Clostridia bacterium]|nr:hypothetical protein FACS189425_07240 [Clostridia bacterium]